VSLWWLSKNHSREVSENKMEQTGKSGLENEFGGVKNNLYLFEQ